ncbi:hypothetical protein Anas_07594 [Armadillidium nasatum]|uniref:Uncharacterized protein n=1 Tax=Armadillidium nasatum TaxID=96803 RepID=A0A5N5T2A2_9CRUS|nr:hypothetical protein Anas_07594 [Armadillidium nasatum]
MVREDVEALTELGEEEFDPSKLIQGKNDANSTTEEVEEPPLPAEDLDKELPKDMFSEEEAKVNEVIRVYMNEDEAEEFRSVEAAELVSGVCISPSEYYSLIAGLMKHKKLAEKNAVADESNPRKHRSGFPGSHPRTVNQPARQLQLWKSFYDIVIIPIKKSDMTNYKY